jgi:hypothetical protein
MPRVMPRCTMTCNAAAAWNLLWWRVAGDMAVLATLGVAACGRSFCRVSGKKTVFLSHFSCKIIIYQDRLGTNTGKALQKRTVFRPSRRAWHTCHRATSALSLRRNEWCGRQTGRPESQKARKPESQKDSTRKAPCLHSSLIAREISFTKTGSGQDRWKIEMVD